MNDLDYDACTNLSLPMYVQLPLVMLEEKGFEAYVVGGCVRDMLLGRKPHDYDITTNATPEQVMEVFNMYHVIPTGIKHGTVTVNLTAKRGGGNPEYGKQVEITTYRIDGKYEDSRHPESVTFTKSLKEDLARRDFTINAMAMDRHLNIVDPFNGKMDLALKHLQCVGNPLERFQEDALRMLRAIRFSAQLGFDINFGTYLAIHLKKSLINNISQERIRDELCKTLTVENGKHASKAFKDMQLTGLLEHILPELYECYGFDQKNPHHTKDVFHHTLDVVERTSNDLVLRLGALFHDIAKPKTFTVDDNGIGHFYDHHIVGESMTVSIMRRLKFDNDTVNKVKILVLEHMNRGDYKRNTIKKLVNRIGVDLLDSLFELQVADICSLARTDKNDCILNFVMNTREIAWDIVSTQEPLMVRDLAINGDDIMQELNLKPSKIIGQLLQQLLEQVLNNPEFNNKEDLLELAKISYENWRNY